MFLFSWLAFALSENGSTSVRLFSDWYYLSGRGIFFANVFGLGDGCILYLDSGFCPGDDNILLISTSRAAGERITPKYGYRFFYSDGLKIVEVLRAREKKGEGRALSL